jgi:hypothetical protein
MKNKTILIILFSIFFNALYAQNKKFDKPILTKSKTKWIAKFGLMNTEVLKTINTTSKIGFQVGIIGEIPISEDNYFNTGLVWQTKGFNAGTRKVTLTYLEVPATWVSKVNFLWLGAGVYAGLPIQTETSFTKADIGFRGLVAYPFGKEKKSAISAEFTLSILPLAAYSSTRHLGIGLNILQYF